MRSIRLQAPTITRKIEHWFTCGADGRTYGHETTKIFSNGEVTKFSYLRATVEEYDTHLIKEEVNRLTSLYTAEEPTLNSTSWQMFPLIFPSPRQSIKFGWKEGREEGKVREKGRKKGREGVRKGKK